MATLDPEQQLAATAPRGPVCIIAGAGTGKTRTITHRIAHLVDGGYVNPDHVLAVTFTNRAAAEMRERLTLMNVAKVQAKTFHAAALRQLGYFWGQYAGDLAWRLESNTFRIVAAAARAAGADTSTDKLRDMIGEITWAKSSLIAAADYPRYIEPARRDCPIPPEQFVKVFQTYEKLKASPEGMIFDFNDILLHMAGAIESNPGIADEFRERYRTFVVDEYQDVTPLQQRVLEAWLGERDDLTVVGDANQTIYSFNGASPNYLLDFSRTYPEATVVRLHRDYRSTPEVVTLANNVISKATGRAAGTRLELEGQRPNGPTPVFTEYPNDPEEAAGVVQHIQRLITEGVNPNSIAVLYRINEQSAGIEYALDQAGLGYQVKGGEGFFNRAEIREAIAALKRAASQFDPEPDNVIPAVQAALSRIGYKPEEPQGTQERQRWNSLNALVELVREIISESTAPLSLPTVLGLLLERAESKNPPRTTGITLASIHAAKGLEWDAVFLIGLNEGMMPIRYALKGKGAQEAIEEERRLFYVGITRAREHLYLSWSLARQPGGKANRKRTRFLDGLVPHEHTRGNEQHATAGNATATSGTHNKRTHTKQLRSICGTCGERLDNPTAMIVGYCAEHAPELEQLLVTKLRDWRSKQAATRDVPAFVICSNATLQAIATQQPRTEHELLNIPGMGPVKVQEFGEDILAIIDNFT